MVQFIDKHYGRSGLIVDEASFINEKAVNKNGLKSSCQERWRSTSKYIIAALYCLESGEPAHTMHKLSVE